jgi:hypothetical protein
LNVAPLPHQLRCAGLVSLAADAKRWHLAHFLLKYTIIAIIMCMAIGSDHMGRTNVVIDDDLVNEEDLSLSGVVLTEILL